MHSLAAGALPTILTAFRAIPKGLRPPAQGCEPASYPGFTCKLSLNPNAAVATFGHPWTQPRWGLAHPSDDPGLLVPRNPGLCCGIPSGFAKLLTRDVGNDKSFGGEGWGEEAVYAQLRGKA